MVGFALAFRKYWKLIALVAVMLSVAYAISSLIRSYNEAIADTVYQTQRANEWKASSDKWQAAFRTSEVLREQESRQAISSANRERNVCNQRVAGAFQSRERINTITRVVPNESNQVCPPAGVINTDELRAALRAD